MHAACPTFLPKIELDRSAKPMALVLHTVQLLAQISFADAANDTQTRPNLDHMSVLIAPMLKWRGKPVSKRGSASTKQSRGTV